MLRNMTHILSLVSAFCMMLFLVSCGGGGGGGSDSPTPPSSKAKWTFMVYLDGDNDLDPYSQADLNEMMSVGSDSNVTILVQRDGYGTKTVRYKVKKGSLTTLSELGELDMSSSDTLRDFISYGIKNHPADHYALVLWDHGSGWKAVNTTVGTKALINDWDNNGVRSAAAANYYIAKGIREAAASTGVTLDVIGIDACDMSTLEAVYEFRDLAGYLVSSQDLIDTSGWDYADLLSRLTANPTMSSRTFASTMVESYKKYAESEGLTEATLSALQLGSGVETVAASVNTAAVSLRQRLNAESTRAAALSLLTGARASVQSFDQTINTDTYVDLYDLGAYLEGPGGAIQTSIKNITVNEYHGSSRPKANGISIVFFDLNELYEKSKFLKRSLYDVDYINLHNTRAAPVSFLTNYTWDTLLDAYYTLQYPVIYAQLQDWPAN